MSFCGSGLNNPTDKMVFGKIKEKVAGGDNVAVAQEEAPAFEKVNWLKEPGLRKLYWHAFVLCVASATTGYDGYVLHFGDV